MRMLKDGGIWMNKRHLQSDRGSAFILTLLVLFVILTFAGLLMAQSISIGSQSESVGAETSSRVLADMGVDHFKLEVDRIMAVEYGGIPSDLTEVDPGIFMGDMEISPDGSHSFTIQDVGVLHRKNGRALEITFVVEGRADGQVTRREASVLYDTSA